jgi:hypothetical protein
MSTVEAVFRFLASYPSWAKIAMLAGLVLTIAVALLAPRTPIDVDAQPKLGSTVVFKIHGVTNTGLPANISVRVTAIVNEKAYTYPSLGAVDWLDVGPTMSTQSFQVPQAPRYDIRFEMEVKGGPRHVSQETIQIGAIPHTGTYRLYPTKVDATGVSRSFTPGAAVRYSIEPAP